ncbi:unnamed protein product [Darwinula stevensoni]|uniref:Peptidase S1 domain-containing protein n=1 Tax=Darwinula stevensoni TaxID=69355 RepID=A0A7R8X7K8_9CRUS|nr:unnamed protein product [Darwinula stevensoni]CAG0887839.1 unnamed protein product [Darwinula stevensoni]
MPAAFPQIVIDWTTDRTTDRTTDWTTDRTTDKTTDWTTDRTTDKTTDWTTDKPTDKPTEGWPAGCGVTNCFKDMDWKRTIYSLLPAAKRIVNGVGTSRGDWPWNVALKTRDGEHVCGGTLIDCRYVITAAHCVYEENPAEFYVSLGDHERLEPEECQLDRRIEEFIIHPNFISDTYQNDVALIRLAEEVPVCECPNIRPICLPEDEEPFDKEDQVGFVTGGLRSGALPRREKVTTMRLIPPGDCEAMVGNFYDRNTMICAIHGKRQVCNGDGGAGLVTVLRDVQYQCTTPKECYVEFEGDCRKCIYTLVGVTSWAIRGCDPEIPSGYARLTVSKKAYSVVCALEKEKVTLHDLLSNIGGIVGVCLGISLITIFDIIDQICCSFRSKLFSRQNRIINDGEH